jgi:zinc-ribbon domain
VLICPRCRRQNIEDARFCTQCGRSLSPEEAAVLAPKRAEVRDEAFDLPPPRTPSPVPGIVGLVMIVLLAGGLGTWWALRPNPCEGKFSSSQFPYCVELPTGWQDGTEQIQGSVADTFAPLDFDPVVLVIAEQAEPGSSTRAFADSQRAAQEADGLFPGPLEEVQVGGVQGLAWDLTSTTDGGSPLHQREVAVVQNGRAWIIAIVGEADGYRQGLPNFQRMLESWSWK